MKKGWETKKLSAVSAINYGYTESAASEPIYPRFLRITDIQNDRVDWDSVPYCKIESADLPKYRLASGDIVFARTGVTAGKSFLVDNSPEAVFASYLIRLRLLDKTFIAFQIAWKLFQSRWNHGGEPTRRPRILFLADRNILANQAFNAFSAFPEDAMVRIDPGDIKKKGKIPKNGSLLLTIFQTFMASGTTRIVATQSTVFKFLRSRKHWY